MNTGKCVQHCEMNIQRMDNDNNTPVCLRHNGPSSCRYAQKTAQNYGSNFRRRAKPGRIRALGRWRREGDSSWWLSRRKQSSMERAGLKIILRQRKRRQLSLQRPRIGLQLLLRCRCKGGNESIRRALNRGRLAGRPWRGVLHKDAPWLYRQGMVRTGEATLRFYKALPRCNGPLSKR